MRTTILIDDSLGLRLKSLLSKRKLSDFINQCLREHFEREERARRLQELEGAYRRASKETGATDFKDVDLEEWPEW